MLADSQSYEHRNDDLDVPTSQSEEAVPAPGTARSGDRFASDNERLREELNAERFRAHNLEIALETSRHIGIAMGILMSTHKITEDEAFAMLRAVSQHRHRKLRDIAEEVVFTGKLPSLP